MMQLRPYQTQAKDAVLSEWDKGHRKTLLVLPTGTGKTVVFAKVVESRVNQGGRALILAHRGELLTQAADKIRTAAGIECALEKAESTSLGSMFPVTVGSVQSLAQPKRLARFPHDYFTDIITFDYCEGDKISGDLFISVDTVRDNAVEYGTEFVDELNRVMVHGVLHLIGYDDHKEEDIKEMRAKENYYLSLRELV